MGKDGCFFVENRRERKLGHSGYAQDKSKRGMEFDMS